MMPKKPKNIESLDDLDFDGHNANKGTAKGQTLVDQSIEKYGAGRSIVADKNGTVIGGNKTLRAARDAGLGVEVIRTSGDKLIVHQRADLSLDEGDEARLLAYMDNRSSELGLEWDADVLTADIDAGLDLTGMFGDDALADIISTAELVDFPELDSEPDGFKRMTFVLTDDQAETVDAACKKSRRLCSDAEVTGNENTNGNALEYICARFNVSN